jgi:ribosome-associated translation inhibitor RaiA
METKKRGIILAVIYFMAILFTNNVAYAQEAKEGYQRSSLHIINIENLNFDNAAKVQASYNKYPFPDKYDDHRISNNSVNIDAYKLTQEEKDALGIKDSELGNALSGALSSATAGILENNSQVKYELDKYIKDKKIAQELVRKWYSIKDDGALDYSVFNERIKLSMSEEDKQRVQQAAIAHTEIDKMSLKLINNTFVVFTKLNFVSNAVPAEAIRQIAYAAADKLSGMLQTIARKAADKIYEKASEGYSVWTTAWLYKLEWNEQIATDLNKLLSSKGINSSLSIDINAFNAMNFNLEFIGQEKATSLVTFSLKKGEGDRTEDEIIDLSTVRNVDKVFTKLQREYEVFKPLYQLTGVDPFSAKLGMKEGLEGGEKFEILEIRGGEYNKIGTIEVDKNKVWDNRYGAPKQEIEQTYFKGKNKDAREWFYVRLVK